MIFKVSLFKLFNELMAVDVAGRESVLCRHHPEGRGQMGFSYAGRAEEDDIFAVFQEAYGGEFINLALVDGGLKEKVKVIQSLLDGKTGHPHLLFTGMLSPGFGFFGKDRIQNLTTLRFSATGVSDNIRWVRNQSVYVV